MTQKVRLQSSLQMASQRSKRHAVREAPAEIPIKSGATDPKPPRADLKILEETLKGCLIFTIDGNARRLQHFTEDDTTDDAWVSFTHFEKGNSTKDSLVLSVQEVAKALNKVPTLQRSRDSSSTSSGARS